MSKEHRTFTIVRKRMLEASYCLMELRPTDGRLTEGILPGQFVEILAPNNATLLRRPISIHFADYDTDTLTLLIRMVGNGTKAICELAEGESLDLVLPLGRSFKSDFEAGDIVILVGGGVGVAPLLYQASVLRAEGVKVKMVYGARTASELVVAKSFSQVCDTEITTDDGSAGTHGRVTDSKCFRDELRAARMVQCCGPAPMMKAVAARCKAESVACEVSLENMMACGLGACLCCVEKTVKGNVCVCTEGPVFNIEELTW